MVLLICYLARIVSGIFQFVNSFTEIILDFSKNFSCYFLPTARLIQPSGRLFLRLDKAFFERGRIVSLPPPLSMVLLIIFLEISNFINILIHNIHNEHIYFLIMITVTVTVTVWSRTFHRIVTWTVLWTHRKREYILIGRKSFKSCQQKD